MRSRLLYVLAASLVSICVLNTAPTPQFYIEPLPESSRPSGNASIEINSKLRMEHQPWTNEEVTMLAQMVWGEARGVSSDTEKAACVWCALNRVDNGMGSIVKVLTKPKQFVGYHEDNPVDGELITLCIDVLTRWYAEKDGQTDVGRVLPRDYIYFSGDGVRNHFRNDYIGGTEWDWSLPSPYED